MTFASSTSLYEVGFNHFFGGKDDGGAGDQVFFQGHASPGIYARAYVEGRLDEDDLDSFRREVGGGGLSSYPHPSLMPEFWEFPTVSMGLGPINAVYQARFNRYLLHRGIADTSASRVWCFLGDGECDEPETLTALPLAAREELDNLTFVVNCNLQRLDGPVRGNGKIIQELEGVFRGAGWNVVKVVWGSEWDPLLAADTDGVLLDKLEATVDGEFQKYAVEAGAYLREHLFGPDPRLAAMVDHLRRRPGGYAARWPRPHQALRRLPGRGRAPGLADGDPGQNGEGLVPRPRDRGPQRRPPDEEDEPGPDGLAAGAAPGARRGARRGARPGRARGCPRGGAALLLPPARGFGRARLPDRPPPRPGRLAPPAHGEGRPDRPARPGRVRRVPRWLRRPCRVDHHGLHRAARRPLAGQDHRPPDRAHRPRRGPHLRHGRPVRLGEDLRWPANAPRSLCWRSRRRPRCEASWRSPGGVETFLVPLADQTGGIMAQVDRAVLDCGHSSPGDVMVIVAGSLAGQTGSTDMMRVHELGSA